MRALKKAIAIVCSTAAVFGFTATALNAMAFESVDLDDRSSELKSGVLNLIADEVYAEPGETVSFRVMVKENSGYAPSGLRLFYDSALKPVLNEEGTKPVIEWGEGSYGLTRSYTVNLEKNLIAYSSMGTENCTYDGVIYTVQFQVPADAKIGTEYPLSLDVDKLENSRTVPLDHNTVDGWIRIKDAETTAPVTTTTSDSVTTTTSTTTVSQSLDTTTGTKPTETSSETTTTPPVTTTLSQIETDVTTASNTKKTERQDPNSSVATTASRAGTTSTAKNAGHSTTTTAAKTGDAGVGIAAAALVLSASVAVCSKRKKEH